MNAAPFASKEEKSAMSSMDPPDAELVAKVKQGDRHAFRRLVERHRERIYRVALGMLRNPDDAMDVVQEVFIRVHGRIHGIQRRVRLRHLVGPRDRELLHRPATPAEDVGRAVRGRQRVGRRFGGESGASSSMNAQIGEALRRALSELGEEHRTAIMLREVNGLAYEEIAEVMGCPKGTVMSRLHHARKKLQLALRPFLEEAGERDLAGARAKACGGVNERDHPNRRRAGAPVALPRWRPLPGGRRRGRAPRGDGPRLEGRAPRPEAQRRDAARARGVTPPARRTSTASGPASRVAWAPRPEHRACWTACRAFLTPPVLLGVAAAAAAAAYVATRPAPTPAPAGPAQGLAAAPRPAQLPESAVAAAPAPASAETSEPVIIEGIESEGNKTVLVSQPVEPGGTTVIWLLDAPDAASDGASAPSSDDDPI
jgi:RNA polymerase sigma-70 factor (ECF subfamily)